MTADERQILRIELRDWDDNVYYADYDNFRVGPEHSQYRLESVGKYSGNAGQYDTKTDIIDYPSGIRFMNWHSPDLIGNARP